MANEIPVYLFVGFLESGKTKFIQETFEDPNFDSGDKTLLLVCEEGEEEYNEKKFAFPGVTLKVLEDKAELNPQNLAKLEKESGAGRVVIEYNGMWLLQDLANNLPENWIVYQCIATADGTTALTYARDNSMRSLLLDKIARSELIVFNRAEAVNNDAARQELHKLVRQASRKCDIAYEFADGSVWKHLATTLAEALLSFSIGVLLGVMFGFLLARRPRLAEVLEPYIRVANSLPRVVLAPIFLLWFGLGILNDLRLGILARQRLRSRWREAAAQRQSGKAGWLQWLLIGR